MICQTFCEGVVPLGGLGMVCGLINSSIYELDLGV